MIVHAIGDEANDRVLTVFETSFESYPSVDHRWRIEHAQVVLPDYYERSYTPGWLARLSMKTEIGYTSKMI